MIRHRRERLRHSGRFLVNRTRDGGRSWEKILEIDPPKRRLVSLEELAGAYVPPVDPKKDKRRIQVTMNVEFSHGDKIQFLNATVATWLRENALAGGVPLTGAQRELAVRRIDHDGDLDIRDRRQLQADPLHADAVAEMHC